MRVQDSAGCLGLELRQGQAVPDLYQAPHETLWEVIRGICVSNVWPLQLPWHTVDLGLVFHVISTFAVSAVDYALHIINNSS